MSTPNSTSDARKAEMARLFDLFEKLKSRRPRPASMAIAEDASMEDVRPAPPLTLADLDPALKKLSNIVDRSTTSTRPRRNTVASIIAAQGNNNDMPVEDDHHSEDDAESLRKFPQAEKKGFPFTFKHMVHKLYEKDDWARAVKEELEKSQNEFKPLAEQMVAPKKEKMEDINEKKDNHGAIRFKMATSAGAGKRASVGGRQRSQSIAIAGGHKGFSLSPAVRPPTIRSPTTRIPTVRSPGAEVKPDLRVLKKRCVGRRKSASGPLNAEANNGSGHSRGAWVYNSAVSVSEQPAAATFATFPSGPPPSPSRKAPSSLKYQPLGVKNLPSTMKGVVGCTGLKRRVSTGGEAASTVPLMMPLQHVTNTNATGLVARRRAMKAKKVDDQDEEERKQVKSALVA